MSVDLIPSTTAYCGREQTSFQLKRKIGKDAASG
ncbi:unnamed protein product [Schistosoma margrebowiei]|uniref:Uncharacterized protein n=1 Tax=Schistosoma margrebowiei TaxID=48269 RepID=A0A183LF88_9TREM|nr:unnamed protein product [Schistosoma margrebowiei]